jgi:nucleotide-binding universal stress UspA family protein
MFQRIIVAVDGSDHSMQAVACAKEIALKFDSAVLIVHAYPHTSDLLGYSEFQKLVAKRKAAGQQIIDKAKALLAGSGLQVTEELLEAPEAEAILAVAESQNVDLIVLGSRGLGSLGGMVFGSVSRKVGHHAPCAVMLVKAKSLKAG